MPRDTKPAPVHTHPTSFLNLLSGWVQQGVESFFASQHILLDLAMRQNSVMIKSLREGLSDPEHSPVAILTELTVEGTSSFIEAQRILLNLAQHENEILMNGVKERVGGSTAAVATTEVMRRSLETFINMQQEFLTLTSKHTTDWLESARRGHFANTHMVELARKAMHTFVQSQKKFLDVISEESGDFTAGKTHKPGKKTELTVLARDASNAFVDAQKKLLDVIGQQMNVNMKTATRTMEMLNPWRLLPMANITGEGVKTFVEAERSIISNMAGDKAPTGKATQRRARRTMRGRKSKAAHAAA